MREIRFRGKLTDGGAWVFGDVMQYLNGDCAIMPKNGWRGYGYEAVDCHKRFKVDPDTVGQFTSLRDRDGRNIYEGDIIKTDFDADNIIVVRFVRGVFAFLWNDDLDDELPTSAPTQEWAIVVGNIHDNPELLMKGGRE